MIDCEFDTLILSLVLIWIFYVFSFNLQLSIYFYLKLHRQYNYYSEVIEVLTFFHTTPHNDTFNNDMDNAKEEVTPTKCNFLFD